MSALAPVEAVAMLRAALEEVGASPSLSDTRHVAGLALLATQHVAESVDARNEALREVLAVVETRATEHRKLALAWAESGSENGETIERAKATEDDWIAYAVRTLLAARAEAAPRVKGGRNDG